MITACKLTKGLEHTSLDWKLRRRKFDFTFSTMGAGKTKIESLKISQLQWCNGNFENLKNAELQSEFEIFKRLAIDVSNVLQAIILLYYI